MNNNTYDSGRRAGSVTGYGCVNETMGAPLVNPLLINNGRGQRSISTDPIDKMSQKPSIESAAFAIISQRFGLHAFAKGRRGKPSNILYRASYKPNRFMLQEWYNTDGTQAVSVIK